MADSNRIKPEAKGAESIPPALAAKPAAKRGRAPDKQAAAPEPVSLPQAADIAAATLVTPPVPEPVEALQPTASQPSADIPAEQPQEETTMATTAETATQTANAAADRGARVIADMNDRAKGAMERGSKLFEEMNGLAKGNVEAVVESGRIAAKGFESLGQEAADYARRSFETATANMRELASAKSPTEFAKLQADFARSAFDQAVAETSRSTEAMLKLAGDIAQPLSNRFAVVADRMKVAA